MSGIIAESIIIKVGHGILAIPRKANKEKSGVQKFNKTLDKQSETLLGVRLSRSEEENQVINIRSQA